MRRLLTGCLLLMAAMPAPAAVKPHELFSSGMVLQRDAAIKLWGTAEPGEVIEVSVQSLNGKVLAGKDGHWTVELPGKLEAGGPYTLTIKGSNTVTLNDVLVGDVWVASGQSNMEWTLHNTTNSQQAIQSSANSKIRLLTVPKRISETPVHDLQASWTVCGPATSGNFSAVAYYFGRDLQKATNIPIGLIHTSWGGTVAEAWTSKAALEKNPALKHLLPKSPIQPGNPNQGTVLFNGMIEPLLPFPIKGAIWYQGESNAGRAQEYRTLFPAMIQSWREAWNSPELPFFFVQLAPWQAVTLAPQQSAWAELREAQLMTSLKLPHTGMAVITDVGDAVDIHPRQKEPVGARLALAAEALVYGKKVEYSGPLYQSMAVEGNKAVLTFSHAESGLDTKYGAVLGFTVAGADKKFYNAIAEIRGSNVVVWSSKVDKPTAVRFGWCNCPVVDLWNKDGLPASPFRTDE